MQESISLNKESSMRKVALTSLAGTSIEWYDFFLYGAAAALVFPTAFFGEIPESTALILSLLTFAAGFMLDRLVELFLVTMVIRSEERKLWLLLLC